MSPNSVLIVYRSFLGATKKYAQWLAEDLACRSIGYRQLRAEMIAQSDVVVVMSGTYAGKMPLVGFLKKYWPALKYKRVFIVAVGVVPPDSPASEASYRSIPAEIRERVWYIKIPGKWAKGIHNNWTMKRDNIQRIVSAIKVDGPPVQ
ncbi:MAG: flavodoxin domain-containing protein [Patescibacteria group bacterium]|jgi:menaquinone-dependent protoporphyrinogen IX oxidase